MGHFKGWILLGRPDTVSHRKHNNELEPDTEPNWVVRLARHDTRCRYVLTLITIHLNLSPHHCICIWSTLIPEESSSIVSAVTSLRRRSLRRRSLRWRWLLICRHISLRAATHCLIISFRVLWVHELRCSPLLLALCRDRGQPKNLYSGVCPPPPSVRLHLGTGQTKWCQCHLSKFVVTSI